MSLWMKPAVTPRALVDRQHPFAVAAGQVIVDGDDVDALALQGVEVGRQRGDQGFAFAGDHLGDVAAVQDDAAEDLHVEVPHVLGAPGGLAAGGERLGQQIFEGLAVGQPFAELGRQGLELLVAEGAASCSSSSLTCARAASRG